jgi:geranylgeranyl diphosphate synthase type II
MDISGHYRVIFMEYLNNNLLFKETPKNLYEPIKYILSLKGKRFRPILTMMSSECFGSKVEESLPAAFAIEQFHNFTLMHDDIMDSAPIRRGSQSVHQKWNVNTAILSGDAMLIKSYNSLEIYSDKLFSSLLRLLNKTALEVCEGQQLDMDFQDLKGVNRDKYIEMIRLKTAVVIGCSLKMGAIIAGAKIKDANLIYDFGLKLGIAFQIQDDYLDIFGNPESFGKQVGGDIIENKKTILYHQSLSLGSKKLRDELEKHFSNSYKGNKIDKIRNVKRIFELTGVKESTKDLIENYTLDSFEKLDKTSISIEKKNKFKSFARSLMALET